MRICLEAAIFSSLVELSADIAAHSVATNTGSDEEKTALAYLKTAHALLGVLALLVCQLRRDLEAAASRIAALAGPPVEARHLVYNSRTVLAAAKAPP